MIRLKKPKNEPKISAGSMADIAFLLLIFFLVATTLLQDKGLMIQLPPNVPPTETLVKDRNLFKIRVNSSNQFLVQEEIRQNLDGLIEEIKQFVLNPGKNPAYAESPERAIISIKTQRGTEYGYFIQTLDQVKEAYYQMYGARVGLASDEFRNLNREDPAAYTLYQKARKDLPMNISLAEPDKLITQ